MRDDILFQCGLQPWALRSQEDLELALARYVRAAEIGTDLAAEKQAARARGMGASGGGVAVIPIYGVIGQATDLFDFPDTPVEWLQGAVKEAMKNDQVSTILFDVNSPGGSVYGVQETADLIRAAGETKRTITVDSGMMASAALWLGLASRESVITPSGEAGSIGVWTAHMDWSKRLDQMGIKVTIISAGEFKVEANPFQALGGEAQAYMQSRVDDYHDGFIKAVATYRRKSMKTVREDFGRGRMFGADKAVEVGMVDRISTLDEVLGKVLGKGNSGAKRALLARRQALLEAEQ